MLWAILTAIVGLIGFFVNPIMFYIGGGISFIFLAVYLVNGTIQKDRIEVENIRQNGYYQRTKNSSVYYANNEEELKGLITQFRVVNIISRAIIYVIVCTIMFIIFKWNGFVWLGIVFGLFYIPEAIKFISGRR